MKDVVVVGAGVIGLAVARELAGRELSVTICDPAPAMGASNVAAGMLAPVTEFHFGEESLLRLNLEAARSYPSFVAALESETGMPTGYRRTGTVMVARDADDDAFLEQLFRFQAELGLEAQRLRASECRALEPALGPRLRGGIHVPGDHQVDPRAMNAALLSSCRSRGVEMIRSAVVAAGDNGCRLEDGTELTADAVVISAGARCAEIEGLNDLPPLRPVKGQLLHIDGDELMPDMIVRSRSVYLVPRGDGRVVVGATMEEKGFDVSVTAGAVYELLRDATELVPGIAEAKLVETIAGLRPATPDNAPIIGSSSMGVVYATGHFRNGVLLAPVTATMVRRGILEGVWEEAFAPARFVRSPS